MKEQNIYKRHEIIIGDYLMSFKDALLKEFLDFHKDFNTTFNKAEIVRPVYDVSSLVTHPEAWKVYTIKYKFEERDYELDKFKSLFFPTAVKLTKEFGDDCPISTYSILEANSIIARHTGVENRSAEFIRIHIPLLVPEGDVFFEVEGEEVDWSDLFAFNNQKLHSAYNYTPHRRLVYLIDIRRSRLGLPPGEPWVGHNHRYDIPPFVRKVSP